MGDSMADELWITRCGLDADNCVLVENVSDIPDMITCLRVFFEPQIVSGRCGTNRSINLTLAERRRSAASEASSLDRLVRLRGHG